MSPLTQLLVYARRLKRRLRRAWRGGDGLREPIIVYQMGKVGSSSLYATLQGLELRAPVYHCHLLHELDELEAMIRAAYPNPTRTLAEIEKGRQLRREIDSGRWRHVHLISLVRAPVQRNVSAFFENLTELVPDAHERAARHDLSVEELCDVFVNRYNHRAPLDWFDAQMQPVFDLDVFARPFPVERGYQTYASPRARLLVIRMEDLARVVRPALQDYLGVRGIKLIQSNVAADKPYSQLYRAFVERAVLPPAYLELMHTSRYATHFYSPAERAQFDRLWSAERLSRSAQVAGA